MKILERKVDIWCDGACKGNPGKGGWGVFIRMENKWRKEKKTDVFEYSLMGKGGNDTTNNRMELTALIEAAKWLVLSNLDREKVNFYIDSAYIINCYEQEWYKNWEENDWLNAKKQPVANKDLWEKVITIFAMPNFHFYKVDGHKGIEGNEKADKLANEGAALND